MKKIINTVVLLLILLFSTACSSITTPAILKKPAILQYGIPFLHVPAPGDIVMYEINPGAFSAFGNFSGITAGLDSIKTLGINTIWIMPIFPIGILNSIGSPYCVRNYLEVNPDYGTLDDYRNLVSEAHKQNMAVIMDWVGNHTSWDNPWIHNKAWYTQDANGNIVSPVGTTWTDVADLNYNNSDMRLAMISAMKFWALTANIDGFRCDAADYIPYDFWKQAIDTLQNMKGRSFILLAEGARTNHFTAGFQLNYAWDFLATLKNVFIAGSPASELFTTNNSEYAPVPEGKWKLRFTTNHDESGNATPVQLFKGKEGALAASVITITLQGAPLIYCGQEVGVSNSLMYSSQRPIDWKMNQDMRNSYRQILTFYNVSNALRSGTLQMYNDSDIIAFTKTYLNEKVLVIVNCRNRLIYYHLPTSIAWSVWTNVQDNSAIGLSINLPLKPYQFYILKK
jgi:glycosidase